MYAHYLLLWLIAFPFTNAPRGARDTTYVFHLIDLAKNQQKKGMPDSAEYYFKRAGELADALSFDNGQLAVAGNYSVFLYEQVRFDEAMTYAERALSISKRLRNRPKTAAAYNTIALQHQARGRLTAAAEHLIKALNISNEIQRPTRHQLSDRRKYLNNLSSLFLDLDDLDKGLQYAWQSFEIAEQLRDTISMGNSLINVMVAEAMSGNLSDAVRHGHQYLQIGQSFGDRQMEIKALNNLADVYRMQRNYPLALETFQKALAITPKSMPGNEVYTLSGISQVFKEMGNPQEAKLYFKKAFKLAETELAKPQLIDMFLAGAAIEEALGNYKEALTLHRRHVLLKDSLRNQEIQKTIQELEVKYETAQHRNSIAERDLKILEQAAELDRKNKWLVIYISTVVILIFGWGGLRLFHLQKRRTKSTELQKQLIEAQLKGEEKERARTAKELHDGVASILSAARMQIHTQIADHDRSGIFREISQLIEIATREVRNISHNLAPEMILREGFAYAIQSFCRRIQKPNFRLHCYVIGPLPELHKNTQLAIYRIIQECVTNILKHAEATEGIVQLAEEQGRLLITVEDNGKGFAVEKSWEKGIGLANLQARISLLQGTLDIRSCPGKGTSIFVEIHGDAQNKQASDAASSVLETIPLF
ncbi:tetratricopeptide repeat protein [Sphingobacterium suaedae]|uniref:Tetratricopeptide repeat protein n=1 Tax=Sphingobacterium suaedae TaxID=1686402 RepID=A0ABW5KM10_9SPHI